MDSPIEGNTSSDTSESDHEEEYIVQDVLAERESDDGVKLYLVKWENYSDESCTWEPSESFLNPQTLIDWEKKRDAGAQLDDDTINKIDSNLNTLLSPAESSTAQNVTTAEKRADQGKLPKQSIKATANTIAKEKRARSSSRGVLAQSRSAAPGGLHPSPAAPPSFVEQERTSKARENMPAATGRERSFHGFSIRHNHKTGHHARRGGFRRGPSSGKFRNLKHMNNVRKILHKEPEPDRKRIRLLSMAEWAEQEPEDINQSLPPQVVSRQFPTREDAPGQRDLEFSSKDIARGSPSQWTSRPNVTLEARHNLQNLGRQSTITAGPSHVVNSQSSIRPDMRNHDRKDFYSNRRPEPRNMYGRFFNYPGELIVQFRFGKREIGDVRIKGLLPWAFGYVFRTKVAGQRSPVVAIEFKDVVTPVQWTKLNTGQFDNLQQTGAVIPYQDTLGDIQQMEGYLRQHNLAALWYHPSEDMMLVFYSPCSEDWLFLEAKGGLPFDSNIRVLTRNKMPPTEVLDLENQSMIGDLQPMTLNGQYKDLSFTEPMSELSQAAAHLDFEDNPMSGRMEQGEPPLPYARLLQLSEGELITAFETEYGISYDHLTAIPTSTSREVDHAPAKARFFLSFTHSAQEEMACVRRFLLVRASPTNICTSLADRGWENFRAFHHRDLAAVVLFHPSSMIDELPKLASMLRSPNLNVFQVALRSPGLDQGSFLDTEDCHLQRLFPLGLAFVLTEGALSDHGIPILRWFIKKAENNRGTKLILPPSIRKRLRYKMRKNPSAAERLVKTYVEIDRLKPEISAHRAAPISESDSSSDDESIEGLAEDGIAWPDSLYSPSRIEAYDLPQPHLDNEQKEKHRESVLVEYFAGWAYAHADCHRKFVAVVRFADQIRIKCGHIEVITPEKFMEREKIT